MAQSKQLLVRLRTALSPEVYSQVAEQLGARGLETVADNQNQNGLTADMAALKPDVLRELARPVTRQDEVSDNQNQNGASLEELMKIKPEVLREIRLNLRSGGEVADNQNQNGSAVEAQAVKPSFSTSG
jgi:hypothetical protein